MCQFHLVLIKQYKLPDFVESRLQFCRTKNVLKKYKTVTSILDAKEACYDEDSCTMFYDVDSQGKSYNFCHNGHTLHDAFLNTTGYLKCK